MLELVESSLWHNDKGRKPGVTYSRLPLCVKEVLKDLKSEDLVDVRHDQIFGQPCGTKRSSIFKIGL